MVTFSKIITRRDALVLLAPWAVCAAGAVTLRIIRALERGAL